jgi:hypothetical protein
MSGGLRSVAGTIANAPSVSTGTLRTRCSTRTKKRLFKQCAAVCFAQAARHAHWRQVRTAAGVRHQNTVRLSGMQQRESVRRFFMNAWAVFSAMLVVAAGRFGTQQAFAESWAYAGMDRFSSDEGIYRSQGVATDGAQWFFSWQYGLERSTLDGGTLERNFSIIPPRSGIPDDIALRGGDHIGDIDYDAGKIYAPIEDSAAYRRPVIAVYDAASLRDTGTAYFLSTNDLSQGVPWVAIDGRRSLAYTAEWENTVRLNVHQLSDFSLITYIPLQQPLTRIQGAKLRGDALYAASDNGAKSIYRISLTDGSVTELLQLAQWFDAQDGDEHELEGLSFLATAEGETLNILMRHGGRAGYTAFYHFRLVAP